jgi:hypothetical protein
VHTVVALYVYICVYHRAHATTPCIHCERTYQCLAMHITMLLEIHCDREISVNTTTCYTALPASLTLLRAVALLSLTMEYCLLVLLGFTTAAGSNAFGSSDASLD